MFCINPMWDNESQRIGKMKCTPMGYNLHVLSDLIGLLGILCFVSIIVFFVVMIIKGSFRPTYFWLLLIPVSLDVVMMIVHAYSWRLASRKGFEYDYESCEASWFEGEKRITYRFEESA